MGKECSLGLKAIGLSLAMALIPVVSASADESTPVVSSSSGDLGTVQSISPNDPITTTARVGGVTVEIRRPGQGVYPLIIFSHGMGGCPANNNSIQSKLADEGYIIVAPKHKDCRSGSTEPDPPAEWDELELWSDATNADRRDDIHAVLDALPDSRFARYVEDFGNVGCLGYSMGGYTCMGLAGAWPSWKHPDIRAVAALSPWNAPLVHHGGVRDIDINILYQGGTLDAVITPIIKDSWDHSAPAKYFQEFHQVSHWGWTDGFLSEKKHDEMVFYIDAFFDRSLLPNGDDLRKIGKKKLTYSTENVVTLWYDHR